MNASTEATESTGRKRSPAHGRLAASAYVGIPVIEQRHATLCVGGECPCGLKGRLYELKDPGQVIRITGGSLMQPLCYQLQKLRCSTCGKTFSADLPKGVGEGKYSQDFVSRLAVNHYYLGMPFNRLASYQKTLQQPLPVGTQWGLIENLVGMLIPVFNYLKKLSANGSLIHSDDTRVRILEISTPREAGRTGCFTTGILSKTENHSIYLFLSGIQHSGENIEELLAKRNKTLPPAIYMKDASSMNTSKSVPVIDAKCLAHGVRKFKEEVEDYPKECEHILNEFKKIYQHDQECKVAGKTGMERLLYHQQNSKPIMDALHLWITEKICEIEPASNFGKCLKYLLKHWEGLTCFLRVADAPLDNNILERALKIAIRLRKNSLYYRNDYGGWVGSVLTSLIYTAVMAKVDPVDYLTALQIYRDSVLANPQGFMPWNYRQTISAMDTSQEEYVTAEGCPDTIKSAAVVR